MIIFFVARLEEAWRIGGNFVILQSYTETYRELQSHLVSATESDYSAEGVGSDRK